jgi:SAM-dependent methyltransferase
VVPPKPRSNKYFDGWYADMAAVPIIDEVKRQHLGLPPNLLSTSGLTGDGIAEIISELRLRPGDVLLDLACGRGGYGVEIVARTGARVIGVDFSAEAVRQAREQAKRISAEAGFGGAEYRIGDLTATGLPASSVSAVLCADSIQFAEPPDAAYAEIRRVLVPAGRVALTCWEAVGRTDESVPVRLRRVDLGAGLRDAGFAGVEVREQPGWRASERKMWEAAVALDPGEDPALRSFHDEGVRSLRTWDAVRRVLAIATAPGSQDG